jgi:DNA-nicking Smr family endonuclease
MRKYSRSPAVSPEDRRLFRDSVGVVIPVKSDLAPFEPPALKPPRPRRALPEWREAESASIPLLSTGDIMSYLAPGMQKKVLRRLRGGGFEVEAEIDLHGLTVDAARRSLESFLATCVGDGERCIHLIHGKGYRSEGDFPILKNHVNLWLRAHPDVLAFCTAQPADGGTGAVYALLRKAHA